MNVSDTRTVVSRIPLNTLSIPFGLAGLAGVWSVATEHLGLPRGFAEVLWVIAAVAWVWTIVAHTIRGRASGQSLVEQLRHPAQGPVGAAIPVIGMLLGAHLHGYWAIGGTVLVIASIAASVLFAAWMLSFWLGGNLQLDAVHGAYLLPTVASAFIAATASASIGLPFLAIGAFAVGAFFWVVVFTVILARLAFRPALPAPLVPTMAILVAPPAVGGAAWLAMTGSVGGTVGVSLAGIGVLMVLVQIALIPRYRALPFSLGFWSFTFAYASVAGYAIDWLSAAAPAGWQLIAAVVLAAMTLFTGTIGVRSILLVADGRRTRRAALRQLLVADEAVEAHSAALAPRTGAVAIGASA